MVNKFLVSAAIAFSACASGPVTKSSEPVEQHSSSSPAVTRASEQAAITRVDPSQVCMVNNHYMGKPQIPIVVSGRTYFGCCDMCKSRLAQDAEARAAHDPVTGVLVDKAASVIGKDASGAVFYFENETNLQRYALR